MPILLLGKTGQVGLQLQRSLALLGQVIALDRSEADLSQPDSLMAILARHKPSIIVNAAAYTAVDRAESDSATAHDVNARSVGVLAQYAARHGILLVHYSTDYVFDGSKSSPYVETDPTNPLNVYGQTKLAGEQAIADSGCQSLVLRTSWVVSSLGNNFLTTILRLAQEREHLRVVSDQFGAPTSAELIADASALAIHAWQQQRLACGLYHLTASGCTSWHGLAEHTVWRLQSEGVKLVLKSENIEPIATSEYPTAAKRPLNSILSSDKLSQALGLHLPDWSFHVDRAIDQLAASRAP
ncbi:dTDP-4-dehydrorhamnose reductase [Paracandidimonas soli]|uniref:dTDP-4-dehydrorhamnose reductase n=1 Tax=Paracandidimonas soli TaxID=1917182 RepID=UPI0033406FBA